MNLHILLDHEHPYSKTKTAKISLAVFVGCSVMEVSSVNIFLVQLIYSPELIDAPQSEIVDPLYFQRTSGHEIHRESFLHTP